MPSSGAIVQSVLSPAGTQASSIHSLWLLMLWVSVAVFAAVLAFVAASFIRGVRRARGGRVDHASSPTNLNRRSLAGTVALTIIRRMESGCAPPQLLFS